MHPPRPLRSTRTGSWRHAVSVGQHRAHSPVLLRAGDGLPGPDPQQPRVDRGHAPASHNSGFAILFLFVWKSRTILSSFLTRQNWKRSMEAMLGSSVLLAGLLTVLGLGLAWSHFGPYSFMGFSGTTIHLNLALLLLPLLVWHSLRHKISFRMRYVAGQAQRPALRRHRGGRAGAVAAHRPSEHPGGWSGRRPPLHRLTPGKRPRLPGDDVAQRPHHPALTPEAGACGSTGMWKSRTRWTTTSCWPGTRG